MFVLLIIWLIAIFFEMYGPEIVFVENTKGFIVNMG